MNKLTNIVSGLIGKALSAAGSGSSSTSRPMKFPYTFTAKIVQFPLKFHIANNWMYRYYGFGILLSVPVFYYISSLANTPSNKATWAEIRRKEAEEHHHH